MSNRTDYDALLPAIQTIPGHRIRCPRQPVETHIRESENLHARAQQDREVLEAGGIAGGLIDELPARAGALREAESRWLTHHFPGPNARRKWIALEWKAFELRNNLLAAFNYAYRKHPDLRVPLSDIVECRWHANPIQDLHILVHLGRDNSFLLENIHYDTRTLDQALALAQELTHFLSAGEHDIRFDPVKRTRDGAYTYLKEAIDSIRDYAHYVYRTDPSLLKAYTPPYRWEFFILNRYKNPDAAPPADG